MNLRKMSYHPSLTPKFIDSNSIYCLLCRDNGYDYLHRRIKESIRGGIYSQCYLLPETRYLLLSDPNIRNSQSAKNLISIFSTYDYLKDQLRRDEIEAKRKEISQNSQCQLNIENSKDREILYLAAVNLVINEKRNESAIVTNKLENFNQVKKNLLIEDWSYSKEVICVQDNEVGLLYNIASLIGDNDVSIVRAMNQKDKDGNDKQNNFEFIIDVPENHVPSDIKRRLANVEYESFGINQTKILCNHLRRNDENKPSNQMFYARGKDRKKLLADIAHFPLKKKYNILASNSYVTENLQDFVIGFIFDVNLSTKAQELFKSEIHNKFTDLQTIRFINNPIKLVD